MRYVLILVLVLFQCDVLAAKAPDFSIGDRNLSDLKGKVVYLDFWASWCGPCKKSFPWLNTMHERYAEQGLVILAVNLDKERKLAEAFLSQIPADFVVTFDPTGDLAKTYKIPGMPTSFLIGRDGEISSVHQGFHSSKKSKYESQIQTLLSE